MYEINESEDHQLYKAFTYHAPHGNQSERYTQLREFFKAAAVELLVKCPRSRELSIAMTHLETANLWANAAIARNEAAPKEEQRA